MTLGPVAGLGDVPHAVVADVDAPELDDDDHHHLARSLRLRAGDELTVTDGRGGWRRCRFGDALEPLTEVRRVPPPAPPITVALARTKGDRPELAVQKLTELGVDRIVVFVAEHSVSRPDPDRLPRQLERLRRVVREAAMQSRRVHLPTVDHAADFAAVAALPGAAIADRGGSPPTLDRPTVLVGPEGGWSDAERTSGLPVVTLGDHVLRAETAAMTAGALLATLRSGLVGDVGHAGTARRISHGE